MEIKAFAGYRFDPAVVGDVGKCIAPPYDVIDEKMLASLTARSDYNIAKITRPKASPTDDEHNNQYTRAGKQLKQWFEQGVLKKDRRDSVYAYVQDFDIAGAHLRRSGFIALGKLEEFGSGVQPHEKTLDGPKADRLKLLRAKGANLGQIFLLYDDPEKVADGLIAKAASRPALLDFVDDDGVRHRLYAIDEPAEIGRLTAMMAAQPTIIADGHHRYEVALQYSRESGKPSAKYRMMTFVNMRNEGLIILGTHRLLVQMAGFAVGKMLASISGSFEVTRNAFASAGEKAAARAKMHEQMAEAFRKGKNAFGLYAADGAFYTLTLKDAAAMDEFAAMSKAARSLDVNVLHKLILDKHLGIGDKQLAGQSNLEYVKDFAHYIDAAVAKVDAGQAQALFWMNPTRIEQVRSVAAVGEKMPQKSTFFYPKIFTGLVVNKL
jgi:uncharacterized protein (DUF1015 family)